jgi:ssDNA-binding Zn-finger/Zn-ribbon topoisomerase 1
MVARLNSATGEAFLGCSRFPACRGTRPMPGAGTDALGPSTRSKRVELSTGGRYARSFPDLVELVIARSLGRTLSRKEGCLVEGLALVGLLVAIYLFAVSGAFMWVVTTFAEWFSSQVRLPGAPTPSP